MTVKIERMAAKAVFDPPTYTQTMKITGAETLLFISGQVAYDERGQVAHPGDFAAQARAINAEMEKLIARCPAQYYWSYNRYKVPAGVAAPAQQEAA